MSRPRKPGQRAQRPRPPKTPQQSGDIDGLREVIAWVQINKIPRSYAISYIDIPIAFNIIKDAYAVDYYLEKDNVIHVVPVEVPDTMEIVDFWDELQDEFPPTPQELLADELLSPKVHTKEVKVKYGKKKIKSK